MPARTRRALALLGVALLLGLLGDALRTWAPGRLDVALWVAAGLAASAALVRSGVCPAPPQAWLLSAVACLLLPCLIWRDAELLFPLNLLGFLGVAVLAAPATAPASLGRLGTFDFVRGSATLGAEALAGPVPAARDVAWGELPLTARARRIAPVFAGLAAAIPVLLLFGSLFGEADPLFRQTMARLFRVDLGRLARHLTVIGFLSWLTAGALRGALWREGRAPLLTLPAGGRVPAGAILGFVGSIGALFALFVGFQARELFLDSTAFQALTGVTISEYARSGFFELLAVAALTLPLLLAADWLLAGGEGADARWFRLLTGAVLVLLGLVLVGAYQRMLLYRDYYGLTEQRFYALAFMTWLAAVVGWFAATVLRGRRPRFLPGAIVAGYAALLTLNVVNPDAVVARVNLGRAEAGAPLDAGYLVKLSADAMPDIVRAIRAGTVPDACVLEARLRERWGKKLAPTEGPGVWNLSQSQAAQTLETLRAPMPDCTLPGTR